MPNSANSACSSISAPANQAACDPQSIGSCAGGTGTECTSVVKGPQATCVATKDDSNSPCAWTSTNACNYETITRMGGMLGSSLFNRTLCGGAFAILETQTQLTSEQGGTGRLGCCPAGSFMSNPLLAPFVIANSCDTCPTGRFSLVENDDTSCASCPVVADGTCNSCSDKDTCTAVTCAVNKFDTNAVATDGCEVGCPVVAGGTCNSCSNKDTCTAVTCAVDKFDTNAVATDGCEVSCPAVAGGTCTSCTNTNGNTQNTGTCLCGTSVCGEHKSLCTAATNSCLAPTCQNIGGIKPNDAACLCGAIICTPKTNPFVVAPPSNSIQNQGLYCLVLSNDMGRCSPAATGIKNALAEIKLLKDASVTSAAAGTTSSDKVTALETEVAKLKTDLAAIVAQYSLIDDVCKKTTGGRRVADTGIGCGGASSDSTSSDSTSSDSTTNTSPASENAVLNAANRSSVGYITFVILFITTAATML